jgi:hypothetical protein
VAEEPRATELTAGGMITAGAIWRKQGGSFMIPPMSRYTRLIAFFFVWAPALADDAKIP